MEDYQADSQGNAMTLTYPVDITGRRMGTWDQWPAQNWTGWDVYWSRVAGQHISMGGGDSWLAHSDAIGSTTMVTDQTGAWVWDQVFGPWGHVWQQTGTRPWFVFAGLRWPVNDPLHPSATREFSSNVFRWMTPDPGGRKVVKLDNPQTWNMYAYVGNNPISRNDPSGLCVDVVSCTIEGAVIGSAEPGLGTVIGAAIGGGVGLALTATGSYLLYRDFASGSRQAKESLAKQGMTGQQAKGGPKAAEAPGVTAGGQATDKYGNKLGPSGKPQVNEVEHSTRKGAADAARAEGPGKPVEHASPQTGKPHFHPADRESRKKPCSTHHNYPCE